MGFCLSGIVFGYDDDDTMESSIFCALIKKILIDLFFLFWLNNSDIQYVWWCYDKHIPLMRFLFTFGVWESHSILFIVHWCIESIILLCWNSIILTFKISEHLHWSMHISLSLYLSPFLSSSLFLSLYAHHQINTWRRLKDYMIALNWWNWWIGHSYSNINDQIFKHFCCC